MIESSRLLCSLFGARAHYALIMHMHAYSAHDPLTMGSAHCLIIESVVPHQLRIADLLHSLFIRVAQSYHQSTCRPVTDTRTQVFQINLY